MRWAARTDSTHKDIRDGLRKAGWLVKDTARLKDWVDLVAYHPATGRYLLVEAKSPGGTRTPSQDRLVVDGWPVRFVESVDQLLEGEPTQD